MDVRWMGWWKMVSRWMGGRVAEGIGERGEEQWAGGRVDLPPSRGRRSLFHLCHFNIWETESWWARHTQNETLAQRRPSLQGKCHMPLHPCPT